MNNSVTVYRITGLDFGEPSLPDSALAGHSVGDTVDLTLDPAVEAILLDAGVLSFIAAAEISIVVLSQAAYDLLTPDADTLYVIVD